MAAFLSPSRNVVGLPLVALGASLLLSACGAGKLASTDTNIVKTACAQVNAALSDGPDSDADPVGFAQAQILPLSQIKVSDIALQKAVRRLDAAYKHFYASSGAGSATAAVTSALNSVRPYCPGVGA